MTLETYLEQESYPFLQEVYLGNTVADYFLAAGIFFAVLLALFIFKRGIIGQLRKVSTKTKTSIDDALISIINSYNWPLYFFVSLYGSVQVLNLSSRLAGWFQTVTMIVVVYYVVYTLEKLVEYSFQRIVQKRILQDRNFDPAILSFFEKLIDVLLYLGGFLVVLQNLGFNVTTLLGGLGVGGIAIAFALQSVLGDVFASLSIFFDKPFKSGDFIVIGDDMGVVEKIGIKSTRIKTLQGEELVVSNKELTETRIHNYKQMRERRIAFTFGITYDATAKQIDQVNQAVTKIIDDIEKTRLDRVHFFQFGDSALTFEVVYFIEDSEYNVYMDIQQQINLAIKKQFEKIGVEMAYPTQTVYVKQ